MLSMNVFQQTTKPKLLYFPSSSALSCHGRRRISPHNPPLLVSFPATKMKFNPKSLHLVHGIQHSSSKHLLASTATMKFSRELFALPRDNEEFSSDNEEEPTSQEHKEHDSSISSTKQSKKVSGAEIIELTRDNEGVFSSDNKEEPTVQEHDKLRTLISSDNVHEEPFKIVSSADDKLKKQVFVVREATNDLELWSSAKLRAGRSPGSWLDEFAEIKSKSMMSSVTPYMCVVALTEEGACIGTLDFVVHNWFPGMAFLPDQFKKEASQANGVISNMIIGSDPLLGVRRRLLKFVIEKAEQYGIGIAEIRLEVHESDDAALAVLVKEGFYDLYKHDASE